jgi:hypothetical protein
MFHQNLYNDFFVWKKIYKCERNVYEYNDFKIERKESFEQSVAQEQLTKSEYFQLIFEKVV